MSVFTLLCALALCIAVVHGRPEGPPTEGTNVCLDLKPSESSPHVMQSGNGGFTISSDVPLNASEEMYSYTAGKTYNG